MANKIDLASNKMQGVDQYMRLTSDLHVCAIVHTHTLAHEHIHTCTFIMATCYLRPLLLESHTKIAGHLKKISKARGEAIKKHRKGKKQKAVTSESLRTVPNVSHLSENGIT